MTSPLPQEPPTVRLARDPLLILTCVSVMLAVAGYAFQTIRQTLAAATAPIVEGPRAGKLEQSAYTNTEAAHITLTNLNSFPVETCLRAIVEANSGGRTVSVPVCTGEMKPRTTTVLVAPYHVGEVSKLCSGEPDRFGFTHVDWNRCTFTTETVK
jgi:hypothetical protein